jgi:hypothetical protein
MLPLPLETETSPAYAPAIPRRLHVERDAVVIFGAERDNSVTLAAS